MAITLLASQQLDEANGVSHSKHNHLPPTHHMIPVPHDSDAMEIDAINLSANLLSFPKRHFIEECKRLRVCTRCLNPYNDTHRTPSGLATCPNAAAPLQAKVDFLKTSKKSNLPKHVLYPPAGPPHPVQQSVAAVGQAPLPIHPYQPHAFTWGQHPGTVYPPLSYGHPAYPIGLANPPPHTLPPPR